MVLLRNILFEPLFYVGSVILVLMVGVASLFSRRAAVRGAHYWSKYVHLLTRYVLGIRIEVDGELPHGDLIVAPKHESFFEALLLPSLFPRGAVVMKRELLKIPVWGWIVQRHGSIFVDRSGKGSAMRSMLREAEAAKAAGREIVVFPEGSRAAPGEEPEIRAGIAGLYRMLKLPVVPVALNSAHVWPKSGLKRPGVVHMRVMPAIPVGLDRKAFEERLHAGINGRRLPDAVLDG